MSARRAAAATPTSSYPAAQTGDTSLGKGSDRDGTSLRQSLHAAHLRADVRGLVARSAHDRGCKAPALPSQANLHAQHRPRTDLVQAVHEIDAAIGGSLLSAVMAAAAQNGCESWPAGRQLCGRCRLLQLQIEQGQLRMQTALLSLHTCDFDALSGLVPWW